MKMGLSFRLLLASVNFSVPLSPRSAKMNKEKVNAVGLSEDIVVVATECEVLQLSVVFRCVCGKETRNLNSTQKKDAKPRTKVYVYKAVSGRLILPPMLLGPLAALKVEKTRFLAITVAAEMHELDDATFAGQRTDVSGVLNAQWQGEVSVVNN